LFAAAAGAAAASAIPLKHRISTHHHPDLSVQEQLKRFCLGRVEWRDAVGSLLLVATASPPPRAFERVKVQLVKAAQEKEERRLRQELRMATTMQGSGQQLLQWRGGAGGVGGGGAVLGGDSARSEIETSSEETPPGRRGGGGQHYHDHAVVVKAAEAALLLLKPHWCFLSRLADVRPPGVVGPPPAWEALLPPSSSSSSSSSSKGGGSGSGDQQEQQKEKKGKQQAETEEVVVVVQRPPHKMKSAELRLALAEFGVDTSGLSKSELLFELKKQRLAREASLAARALAATNRVKRLIFDFAGVPRGRQLRNLREALVILEAPLLADGDGDM
jgi:hypothetical protein